MTGEPISPVTPVAIVRREHQVKLFLGYNLRLKLPPFRFLDWRGRQSDPLNIWL